MNSKARLPTFTSSDMSDATSLVMATSFRLQPCNRGVCRHRRICPLEPSDQPVAANHQWRSLHDGYGARHSYTVIPRCLTKFWWVCVGNICRSPTAGTVVENYYQPGTDPSSSARAWARWSVKAADEARQRAWRRDHHLSLSTAACCQPGHQPHVAEGMT